MIPVEDSSTEEIEIDFFRDEDAPGVARLFREVYGEAYPIRTYYIPEKLIEENASGRIISSVARTSAGEVAGHNALILLDSPQRIFENAAGAVRSTFRGQRIFPRLFRHSLFEVAMRFEVEAIIGEPVCSHPHLQKMCLEIGFTELGLEVDLMPAAAYTSDPSVSGRVSVLQGCFKYRPQSQEAHIPSVYRKELEFLYSEIKGERTFFHSAGSLPAEGSTRGRVRLFPLAQVARIYLEEIGADFDSFMIRSETEARDQGAEVFQTWLPLASPFAPVAADILRAQCYFFGGMLPCLADGDCLLMQKLPREPNWDAMVLHSDRAKRIMEMVRGDWAGVIALSGTK